MRPAGVSPRLSSAILVVALHVPLIIGLITMNFAPGVHRLIGDAEPKTEVVLPLPPLPRTSTAPVKGPAQSGSGSVVSPATTSPYFSPPAAAANLGVTLFGCSPENLRTLSREQQEKCLKLSGGRYVAMKDGLPVYVKPPGPEWEGLRNSDIRARERNTADPCLAAKATGTDCIHEVLFGKKLW